MRTNTSLASELLPGDEFRNVPLFVHCEVDSEL